jgi:adenylate cyclase
VFVGVTETGIADVRATPLAPAYPGVEMHATLAANVLEQRFLTRDSRTMAIEIGAMLALPLLLTFFQIAVSGPLYGFLVFFLSVTGYIGGNFLLFDKYHFDLSLAYPLLPLAFTYVCGECYRNLVVERKGRQLKKAFSTYLSADLVSEIAKNPNLLKLGGETRVISILFSDIRGFTTLSEKLTPEELVALLNQYLSPMTRIVMEERGTLDKFIGDAIMAFFNAPLEVPDHPGRSCRCALRMIEELAALNAKLTLRNVPEIKIGIGIHTGEAVVGNMGADIRFDYTAIGDSVNLSSRLEGLTKFYGVPVIVSDATRKQVGSEFHFRELDLVRVKGKHEPVAVYELITKQSDHVDSFAEGMRLYRERDFASALKIFESLSKNNDTASGLYVERCKAFLTDPPAADWDGVYVALRK